MSKLQAEMSPSKHFRIHPKAKMNKSVKIIQTKMSRSKYFKFHTDV